MPEVFFKTLPFFAVVGLGWLAGWRGAFPAIATSWLTRFVFYFALSAMLFRFSATLEVAELFDPRFVAAWLAGSTLLWAVGMAVARMRGLSLPDAAMEAQCCMTGNTGFLGVPMLVTLLGPAAAAPVLMVLALDMVVYSTLITVIMTAARHGRLNRRSLMPIIRGIVANPMIVSMAAGLAWGGSGLPMPAPLNDFLGLLGGAATPGALFAIGASLALRRVDRPGPALWLTFAKLVLHPLLIAVMAFGLFGVDRFSAGVMVVAAALPVAGNVYMLAEYFGTGVQRTSTAILFSTAISLLSVPMVIYWIEKG
ncbi:AEC family transporter [Paracoccus jiaweipingae]|uniref:AEC family transporter n=1 Tax=unclassified Paracoccus (in: a-proteobacteria) TaxID=2688777 RepID=UPI00379B7DFE